MQKPDFYQVRGFDYEDSDDVIFTSLDKCIQFFIRENWCPSYCYDYSPIYGRMDGVEEKIDVDIKEYIEVLELSEEEKNAIVKDIDEKRKSSQERWDAFWKENPGACITGSQPFHHGDRNRQIQDSIKKQSYKWKTIST